MRYSKAFFWTALGHTPVAGSKAEREGKLRERVKFLSRYSLLIVNQIGYLPLGLGGGILYFQLVNACHGICSANHLTWTEALQISRRCCAGSSSDRGGGRSTFERRRRLCCAKRIAPLLKNEWVSLEALATLYAPNENDVIARLFSSLGLALKMGNCAAQEWNSGLSKCPLSVCHWLRSCHGEARRHSLLLR